jgi:hypothetical protein
MQLKITVVFAGFAQLVSLGWCRAAGVARLVYGAAGVARLV